jgi:uncharacterized membrane protein
VSLRDDFILALLVMGLASFLCRAGGFFAMRFVPVTPRLECALRALPLGVMIGIIAPTVSQARLPECVGLTLVIFVMMWRGNDLQAALAGVAGVALVRLAAS